MRKKSEITKEDTAILTELLVKYDHYKLDKEIRRIDHEMWEAGKTSSQEKYKKNQEAYQRRKAKNEEAGEKFHKTVKKGDIVQMRGTNDGRGYRLVLNISDYEVECRKLSYQYKNKTFKKEPYVTTHGWDKVRKVLIGYKIED